MNVIDILKGIQFVFRGISLLPHYITYRHSPKREIINEDIRAFLKSPNNYSVKYRDYL